MARRGFDRQLCEIQRRTLLLGGMAAQAIERSVVAHKQRDAGLARAVIANDGRLDDLARDLGDCALLLMATQQPVARDLRIVSTVLAIVGELERIGDYAEGIAKLTLRGLGEPSLQPPPDLPQMAEQSIDMLRRSLDAFSTHNSAAATAIWHEDDAIDALQNRICNSLLRQMCADTALVASATRLLCVTHNLERVADRATNICERTVFMVSGSQMAPQRRYGRWSDPRPLLPHNSSTGSSAGGPLVASPTTTKSGTAHMRGRVDADP